MVKNKPEVTKRNGENGMIKDCIIEDATGNAVIHICDKLIVPSFLIDKNSKTPRATA